MSLQEEAANSLVANNKQLTNQSASIFSKNVHGIAMYRKRYSAEGCDSCIALKVNARSYHTPSESANHYLSEASLPSDAMIEVRRLQDYGSFPESSANDTS